MRKYIFCGVSVSKPTRRYKPQQVLLTQFQTVSTITFKFNKFSAVCNNLFNSQIVCHFLITTNIASNRKKHRILTVPLKMPVYAEKICEKCGNMQNMWQSHILVKLASLADGLYSSRHSRLLFQKLFKAMLHVERGFINPP